jgi:hypothetical protein
MWHNWQPQIRRIPLFGPLVDCHARDHAETLGQTLIVLLLSTAPLWLGGLVIFGISPEDSFTLGASLRRTIGHGELFMYGTALLAPMFWVALVDPPGARVFPSKIIHMVLIAVIELIASVFFGLTVAGNHLRQPFVFHLSVGIFLASLVLLYLGTLYHSNRLNAAEAFKQDEQDFSQAYEEHRQ